MIATHTRSETSAGEDTGVGGSDPASIQVKIRVTPSLLARLQGAAAARGVAFNREIVIRLIDSFTQDDSMQALHAHLEKMHNKIDTMSDFIYEMHGQLVVVEAKSHKQFEVPLTNGQKHARPSLNTTPNKEGDDG